MSFWVVAAIVNGVVAVAYLMIAGIVGRGIHATGQWRTNPLAVATFLIFLSCGVGHGTHVEHLLMPGITRDASRVAYDLHLVAVDLVTAFVAIYYVMLRKRFPALLHGPAMFEDLTQRRRQALDIHDNIVQQLATAKLALELEHDELGLESLTAALESSKRIITHLVGDTDQSVASGRAGGLRRQASARAR